MEMVIEVRFIINIYINSDGRGNVIMLGVPISTSVVIFYRFQVRSFIKHPAVGNGS